MASLKIHESATAMLAFGLRRSRWAVASVRQPSRGLKVGDKVPIAFVKDAPVPVIKEDKDYPSWLFTLTDKLSSKNALIARAQKDGIKSLTTSEMKRTKRLITLETIKENNLLAKTAS